jgi:hypothetical protein
MDKYSKIQKLVELQKERSQKLKEIFQKVLGLEPGFEVDFVLYEKLNYKKLETINLKPGFLVKLKVKDKSSVKFVVLNKKEKILEEYSNVFPDDCLVFC